MPLASSTRERVQPDSSWQSLQSEPEALDEIRAWSLLRAVARLGRAESRRAPRLSLALDGDGEARLDSAEAGCLEVDAETGEFELRRPAAPGIARLFELYLPVCVGRARPGFVFAHIGQSLDGQIATSTGASQYVTGPENIRHLHRLRALCDAVVVGASTVEHDDPQLTTRLVPGDNPVRVVIDPTLRLSQERKLFRDAAATTLVVCGAAARRGRDRHGQAELVSLDSSTHELSPGAVVEALSRRGLRALFVEGGGVTVSRFLQARALDRLHLTVSPVFLGQGKPGIVLPAIDDLTSALRPNVRRFSLGDDVLFDCAL
jgi:diaminohydroxyphosphoribosylaminopyrimidine deaminase/5-amino-6-(5-phosphoribosylamino)uracil reductase